jgi:hypothetical protein
MDLAILALLTEPTTAVIIIASAAGQKSIVINWEHQITGSAILRSPGLAFVQTIS